MRVSPLTLFPISLLLFFCKNHDASNSQPKLEETEIDSSPSLDTTSITSIRFIQILKSQNNGASFYTQDDCRCTQATASFNQTGEFNFSVCDTVYPNSRYAIVRKAMDSNGLLIYATHQDTMDTISIQPVQSNPMIFKIHRSNYFEIESGEFFIDAKDSSKFEHQEWDCDEYQG